MAQAFEPPAGAVADMQEKLRTITDQTWIRKGSALVCAAPLRNSQLDFARDNLQGFELYPEELPTSRGTSLSLDLEIAYDTLAAVSKQELNSWAKGA